MNNHISLQLIDHKKKAMTYDMTNLGPGLESHKNGVGLNWLIGSSTLRHTMYINKQ
jgi:hypothetical protein